LETATHLGMQPSKTDKETIENTVNENIKKARSSIGLCLLFFLLSICMTMLF
jgi:hypothetical protein